MELKMRNAVFKRMRNITMVMKRMVMISGCLYLFYDLSNGIESHHTGGLLSACILGLSLCVGKQKHISFSPKPQTHTNTHAHRSNKAELNLACLVSKG